LDKSKRAFAGRTTQDHASSAQASSYQLLLQWHITERCNLRCTHCYQGIEPSPELAFSSLLGILGQYKALLDQIEAKRNAHVRGHISITGGEPFVRSDCIDLLGAISVEKPRISFGVLTNGTFIDAAMARELRKLGPRSVQVSIEGTESTHDRIRGRGNFQRTKASVRNLICEGVPTTIAFTAHRSNYHEFPEVARLGRKLQVLRVWSDRLIPMGRGCDLETLTPAETRQFFGLMHTARQEAEDAWFGRTTISMARGLQFLAGGCHYRCKAGSTLLTILSNGDLCPCRRMPIYVGNVLKKPLSELYFDSEVLRELRDPIRVSEGCEACKFERQCRGGLRCLAYALHGTPFRADPGCWLAKHPTGEAGFSSLVDQASHSTEANENSITLCRQS
jgi:radical SAM protein with 4Fe4S-binding SPASM domain